MPDRFRIGAIGLALTIAACAPIEGVKYAETCDDETTPDCAPATDITVIED